MRSRDLTLLFKIFFFVLLLFLSATTSVLAQGFTIKETLRDSEASSFTFGGSLLYPEAKAYLTSGIDDPTGDGWLRLTRDLPYQAGSAIVNQPFPSKLGVLVDLEYKTWRQKTNSIFTGADGFSAFLFDASVPTFQIGGFGGSLGYAPHEKEGLKGLSGGFVGIGVDEFGNYSNPTEGRTGGVGFLPNSIGVRGPSPDYAWLAGKTSMSNFNIQYEKGYSATRPSDSEYYRRIQIEIVPVKGSIGNQYSILVRVKDTLGRKFKTLLGPVLLPTVPPDSLKLGFAASTGGDLNFHEVRNLFITTPGGVRITKQVDKTDAVIGDELTYTMDIYNQTETAVTGLHFSDPLDQFPSEFQVEEVTFSNDGEPLNTATGYSNTNLSNVSVSMEAFSHASFTIRGIINAYPPNNVIKNTAIFNIGTAAIDDPDTSNDTASVSTNINPKPFFIPNVYTPNGDGINDFFEIVGLESYDNPRLKITDRWGDEVYYNPNYKNDWNGYGLNGGTYYYYLILNANGREFVYKGWVLIKK